MSQSVEQVEAAPYTSAEFKVRWGEVKEASRRLDGPSLADQLADVEADEPGFVGEMLDALAPEQALMLAYDESFWLRPKQLEPIRLGRAGTWRVILFCAGRGNGKTRGAAAWIVDRLEHGARMLVLVGPSYDDIKTFMLGGLKRRVDGGNGSGLLDCLPPWIRYHYKEDEGVVEFPDFKAEVRLHSAEVPEYRGPEPDSVWGDELLKWRWGARLLSNLRLACRAVGKLEPQILLTTSPKRLRILRDLVMESSVHTIHGAANENVGNTHSGVYEDNLRRLTDQRTGKLTRQGEEEMGGELGVDEEGDLFPMGVIESGRVDAAPIMDEVIVSIDPSGSDKARSDSSGIVPMGRRGDHDTGHGYVLGDRSGKHSPEAWAEAAFGAAEMWGASAFILERNYGADLVARNLRATGNERGYSVRTQAGTKTLIELVHDRDGRDMAGRRLPPTGRVIKIVEVLQTSRTGDKEQRARPVSTLYHTGRIHHVGALPELDAEISDWIPDTSFSPGRLDAMVTGATYLFGLDRPPGVSAARAMVGMAEANKRLDVAAPRPAAAFVTLGGGGRERGGRTI